MSKLTNDDMKKICLNYANNFDVSMDELAKKYNCSRSSISTAIKKAIVLGLVDLETAKKVKNKSVANVNSAIIDNGYSSTKKVDKAYDKLFDRAKEREKLVSKLHEMQHKADTYDSTFSDADEISTSKEDYEDEAEKLKKEIKDVEKIR